MSPDLPAPLRLAAERLLEGVSRKGLAERAARISQGYRAGAASAAVVADAADAMAYVLSRLPATYAACAAAFGEALRLAPDFTPARLLDAGAGPGGAGWAALEVWPGIEAATLLDASAPFLKLAGALAERGPPALRDAARLRADLTGASADWPQADLVTASYALAEIPPARQAQAIEALWAACDGVFVLVEPGTPAGHGRILAARDRLLALGARILAPCPHENACPLSAPDWCHFSQRLARSRDHQLAKGAVVPFEDEKFAYLVAARPNLPTQPRTSRVLARPQSAKAGIGLKLCTATGLETTFVARRDKVRHALVRRLDWGDVLPGE